jgi:peroxiredoxin
MHAYRDQYAQIFNLGRGVTLMAISADSIGALESWARDEGFPFLMASDENLAVARQYGAVATRGTSTNRNLFVVGPDGRIAYRAAPFREIDPTAYDQLGAAIAKLLPEEDEDDEGS